VIAETASGPDFHGTRYPWGGLPQTTGSGVGGVRASGDQGLLIDSGPGEAIGSEEEDFRWRAGSDRLTPKEMKIVALIGAGLQEQRDWRCGWAQPNR